MTAPYTHADHAAHCREQALRGFVPSGRRVQVKKRGVVYCAKLREPWTTPDGLDCWTVEADSPEHCRMTVPVRMVVACGPGCVCAGGEA